MNIALILPSNIWLSPYVKIYTDILDHIENCDYDIISWNRDGRDEPRDFQFNELSTWNFPMIRKLMLLWKFSKFSKSILRKNKYDRLIIFGPQMPVFSPLFISYKYRGKYILDYRDLSIEQKPGIKQFFDLILRNSALNVISSPGFKKVLNPDLKYLISHNFDYNNAVKLIDSSFNRPNKCSILTIGSIRDYTSNVEVIKGVANNDDIIIKFVGRGGHADLLKEFVLNNQITNCEFEGFYPKEKEGEYIINSSWINIFYPNIITHQTALSNRFYNALLYKRPMIVTKNSIQGDLVEQYNLGIAVCSCDNLVNDIETWERENDYNEFCQRCKELLAVFIRDYKYFKNAITYFATS